MCVLYIFTGYYLLFGYFRKMLMMMMVMNFVVRIYGMNASKCLWPFSVCVCMVCGGGGVGDG